LQARPDRISVQGFYADAKGVVLIISSASGVRMSPNLNLKDAQHYRLIYGFVQRLYDPLPAMLDPTVKRRMGDSFWVFDITLTIYKSPSVECAGDTPAIEKLVECAGYTIEKALGFVGRRTHIFVNIDNPASLNGVAITVIKDQYCRQDHRFNEAEVLQHIHKGVEVPGVVHMVHSEDVKRDDGIPVCSGDRYKRRIGLAEYGKPFMDLKTPLEALKAIYDLLESELEFDMPGLLLILFGQNSYATLVFQAQRSTSRYQQRKFTVYGGSSAYWTNKYLAWGQFLFYQAFIGSNVSPLVFTVNARAQCLSVWRPVLLPICWLTLIDLRFSIRKWASSV